MMSYLHEGVHFEFSMPLQIVLFPHLFSVWHGFESLQKEARRLSGTPEKATGKISIKEQWTELFARLPYLPIWILAHGATPRKLEPDRWRSTVEGGGPRYEMWDTEGVPVRSINERTAEYPHPPEIKPTPAEFAQDVAVLNAVRGVEMFRKLEVPVLGVVENMSWVDLPDGSKMRPFGEGGGARTAERFGVPLLAQVPLDTAVRAGGDDGRPVALDEAGPGAVFREIASQVADALGI